MIFDKKQRDNIIKKLLNFFHSKGAKYSRYTLYLTIVGFILRLVGALNLEVLADDMVYASQSAGILSAKLISTHSNPPLFFYLTDLSYKIFGYSTFASRFWPLIAGTLLIPLVYLISNNLLNNKKASFFAALFVATSSFLIRMTFTEQSLVVLFFIFLGVYLGMLFTDKPNKSLIILSSIFFGLALLTKYNAPFFIISFAGYLFINKNLRKDKKIINLNNILLFIGVLVLFSLPFISFNYILYNQKGIVDVYFSRLVHLKATQELYGGLGGQENSFLHNLFTFSNYGNYKIPLVTDTILLLFAIYGAMTLYKTNKKAIIFLGVFLIIPFVLQSAGAPLQKHFVFMPFLLAIPAGVGLEKMVSKLNNKYLKIFVFMIIILSTIFFLGKAFGTPFNYFSKGPTAQLKSFINEEVSSSSLIVFDSRIYTSRSMWLATDKAYLNFDQAPSVLQQIASQNVSTNSVTKVYFVECVVDDCGWGWVGSNKNLNSSSEKFLDSISSGSDVVKKIYSKVYNRNELISSKEQEYYRIYSSNLRIPSPYLEQIKKLQSFYFAPYLYKNMANYLYNYDTSSTFTNFLDNLSYSIIILGIIFAILAIIILLFIFLISY